MSFKGKTVIITGGGRDIGRACAMLFAKAGANVAINYHQSGAGADSAVQQIQQAGGQAFAMQGDMTQPKKVQDFVQRSLAEFGKIDIVVPVTGGLLARKTVPEITPEHWQAVLDLNLTSAFLLIQSALPHIPEGGAIVTMASQAGRDGGGPGAVAYATAKAGVMSMTRGLAKEFAPNIRVNSICAGMIDTDFHNVFTKPEVRKHVANITPLKREGQSTDVANLTLYLASEQAAFITGACIDINGGMLFS